MYARSARATPSRDVRRRVLADPGGEACVEPEPPFPLARAPRVSGGAAVRAELGGTDEIGAAHLAIAVAVLEACEWLNHGVLLVDAAKRVHYANARARQHLASLDIFVEHHTLRTMRADETAELHRLIVRCSRSHRSENKSSAFCRAGHLLLQVVPLSVPPPVDAGPDGCLVALYITDPYDMVDTRADQLSLQFGLTPAEARLACEIIKGDGLTKSAARLGVSRATASTQLRYVFEKTNTIRQAGLVRRVLASRPVARRTEPPG